MLMFEFTFHYGPIQIQATEIFNKIGGVFTFHYGPIQIQSSAR